MSQRHVASGVNPAAAWLFLLLLLALGIGVTYLAFVAAPAQQRAHNAAASATAGGVTATARASEDNPMNGIHRLVRETGWCGDDMGCEVNRHRG